MITSSENISNNIRDDKSNRQISFISTFGENNPAYNGEIFNLEAPTEQISQRRFSLDSYDETNESNRGAKYHDIIAPEIDILCCNNVYSIRTRTYVNLKKSISMLMPVFVLILLIVVLIVFFKIDLIFEGANDSLNNV